MMAEDRREHILFLEEMIRQGVANNVTRKHLAIVRDYEAEVERLHLEIVAKGQTLDEVRTALDNGADDSLWRPGEDLGEAVTRLRRNRDELAHLISKEPHNLTLLPGWAQRLWEACVRLSDKAELKVLLDYIESLEKRLHEANTALEAKAGERRSA